MLRLFPLFVFNKLCSVCRGICFLSQARPDFFGGIAQLGEHLPCKQGVSGSIPLTSTKQLSVSWIAGSLLERF